MTTIEPPPLPDEPPTPAEQALPFRFGMRTMLIAMTAFAVWCAGVAILPFSFLQMLVGLCWIVVTTWLVAGLIFSQGDRRAFCLGALVVVSSMWSGIGGQYMNGFHKLFVLDSRWSLWSDFLIIALTAAANGWICIKARRYFQRDSTAW